MAFTQDWLTLRGDVDFVTGGAPALSAQGSRGRGFARNGGFRFGMPEARVPAGKQKTALMSGARPQSEFPRPPKSRGSVRTRPKSTGEGKQHKCCSKQGGCSHAFLRRSYRALLLPSTAKTTRVRRNKLNAEEPSGLKAQPPSLVVIVISLRFLN